MNTQHNSVVAIFNKYLFVEEAVKSLVDYCLDIRILSIVGIDYETEEPIIGFFQPDINMPPMGKTGLFWFWLRSVLIGPEYRLVPEFGPIIVTSPLRANIDVHDIGQLSDSLIYSGIPNTEISQYESALKAHKFLVIIHGALKDVELANTLLSKSKAEATQVHFDIDENYLTT